MMMRRNLLFDSKIKKLYMALTIASASFATAAPYEVTEERAPCVAYSAQRTAHFGDLHIHTALSLDAAMQDTITTPHDAYLYAQGKTISIPPYGENGEVIQTATIDRPLDFAAVTDHANLLGEQRICSTPGAEGYWSMACIGLRVFPHLAGVYILHSASNAERLGFCGDDGDLCRNASRGPWLENQQAAEHAYDRSSDCEFTSFVGYEWTAANMDGSAIANLHRNVIFKNAEVPDIPESFIDKSTAPALWRHLQDDCSEAGGNCDAVVIPHNSNISLGLMFQDVMPDGQAITAEDAQLRQRYETLVELIQHKGASECYFGPNTTDELCDFEQLPWNSFSGNSVEFLAKPIQPDAGFAREVLKDGLALEQRLGVNPFKFGFVGSTDTHRSLAGGVAERDFPGHGGAGNAGAEADAQGLPDEWEFNPGGLSVLYAEENTRDSLFAAMQRREAYATSGPRINVRFFGGWDFPADMCQLTDFVSRGYEQGVPMGSDLKMGADLRINSGDAPRFLVSALKDPGTIDAPGVDLQRVQIIKGWLDAKGQTHEQVFDVAGNANNGAWVDLASCETQGVGAKDLCAVWQDPEFDSQQKAFYYSRVLENPSCRWNSYVCNAQKVNCSNPDALSPEQAQCCQPEMKKTIQERAWTSPIWYDAQQ